MRMQLRCNFKLLNMPLHISQRLLFPFFLSIFFFLFDLSYFIWISLNLFPYVCFQDIVNLLQNTIEQLKNVSLHEAQSNSITEQERKGFVFNMVIAFEDFALKYGQYHLSESMPELINVQSKLGK